MKRHVLLACSLAGCAYKVELSSVPASVEVELPDGSKVTTPAEVELRWAPFQNQQITAVTQGYRPLVVDLRRDEIRFHRLALGWIRHPGVLWGETRGHVQVILVPDHGPAGTWTIDDLPR
jgi:hypothetical protein